MQYVTNVSFIQAFRQLSLPLGFLAGVLFLHEKSSATKITGLLLILAGLLTTTGVVHQLIRYVYALFNVI
jgi:drug/metabolite transporter (DMT)-like permease